MFFLYQGNLASGIEQLRTCDRCHRVFPVLSDLFNHMCDDDEDDLIRTKSTLSSPTAAANKQTSDRLFHTNTNESTLNNSHNNHEFETTTKPKIDHDATASPSLSSTKSFKLNRRSSFNDSLSPSNKLFSPPSTPLIKEQLNSTYVSPLNRSRSTKSPFDAPHIPVLNRPLYRPDSTHFTRISSSPSPRPLFNGRQQYSSTGYINLQHPSSPMRVNS